MSDFIDSEFASLNLGDERRHRRLRSLFGRLLDAPSHSIKAACAGWAETMAAYRLLNSENVTLEAILRAHRDAALQRASQHQAVALLQDTSELDFTKKSMLEGSGPLAADERRGFFLHSQYLISEDRLPLGLIKTHLYARDVETNGKKSRDRKKLPIEQKESYRWLEGYREACRLASELGEQTEVFSISDREGDIYEIFHERHLLEKSGERTAAHWIVRANRDRALLDPETLSSQPKRLFEEAANGEALGIVEFEITQKQQRKATVEGTRVKLLRSARTVRQRLRVCRVTARPPYRRETKLPPVTFWVIRAEEIDPPEAEEPINWVILTSKKVESFEQAQRILGFYLGRWEIEVFHRVLKTGCRVEEIQLKSQSALRPALALYLVVAWRIVYLTHLGRACPRLPCSVVFEAAEWKSACAIAARNKPVTKAATAANTPVEIAEPTLGEFITIVARFGGHLGRKCDGPPGAQAMWQGLRRVRDFALAWESFAGA